MSGDITEQFAEPIVISGMAGRFPESDSTDEFANNMYNNVDLTTDDDRRWPTSISGMNHRMGRLKQIDKVDGTFFGNTKLMGDSIDPQSRILLETTYEAIIDAGINPQNLQGTNTGVYIGFTPFGAPDGLEEVLQPDCETSVDEGRYLGGGACLYPNRVSYMFDFKGPSMSIDTGCSSSGVALDIAMNDLKLGKCNQAIVGGAQISQVPWTNQIGQFQGMNAPDGIPKAWDKDANGFVRAEGVVCLLLQRKSKAKRIYATVLNSGVNNDGNKKEGIAFPSHITQHQLMARVMKEVNVKPENVTYFEPHGTGTRTGDTQEATSIYNSYCRDVQRDKPLYIGLLKSITGHQESAAGVSSVVKLVLAYENECIPANLHLNEIKSTIKGFCPPLLPVRTNTKYVPGIAGVNNFGIGGTNAHILLEPNYKTAEDDNSKIVDIIPRIVNICCRTELGFNQMCDWIEENPQKVTKEFLSLLAETMRTYPSLNSSGMPFRGSVFIKRLADNSYEYKRQYSLFERKTRRPVWFVFPGLGGEWVAMAKALMPIKAFEDTVEECHQILKPHGINLKHLLLSDDPKSMSTMTNKFCAKTAIQISLVNVIKTLGITPDGIIGHSFGEIAAAYADGCLTIREALMATLLRGVITEGDKEIPRGGMAVVGLSWEQAESICPEGVKVVCNNDKDLVVVSGLENDLKQFIKSAQGQGLFVKELTCSNIPYHTQHIKTSAEMMEMKLKEIIISPKLRSNKWISTARVEPKARKELNYASAEYFAHNLISPVYFYDRVKQIPDDTVVVEFSPHGLFSGLIKSAIKNGDYISFMKKESNHKNLDMFLDSIAKLYELGLNPNIESLYTKVEWPVSRGTQSIASLMKWDHTDSYFVKKYPDFFCRTTASDMNLTINLKKDFNSFLLDHRVDNNIVYPGTGYLMLAWRQMAATYHKLWNEVPVVFECVQFRRPVFLSETEVTKLKVKFFESTGDFVILEGDNICCSGKVKASGEHCLYFQHLLTDKNERNASEVELSSSDIYKDLRINGYDYGLQFRNLKSVKTHDFKEFLGQLQWNGNMITLMDSLLQTSVIVEPIRQLRVPVMIRSLRCDPRVLYKAVESNRIAASSSQHQKQSEQNTESEIGQAEMTSTYIDQDKLNQDYKIFESSLPFYMNCEQNIFVSNGLEIESLSLQSVARKSDEQTSQLDSYQFIANNDSNAIQDCDLNTLLEYIQVCSLLGRKCIKHLDNCKYIGETKDMNGDKSLVNKYLDNMKDEYVLLKLLKEAIEETNNSLGDKPDYLGSDLINKVSKNECLIRPFVEIVSENNVPKKEIKILEINYSKDIMAEEVDSYISSSSTLTIDVDYTIAVKSVDGIPHEYKKKSNLKTIEWKASDSSVFPSEVKDTDLIVYKDTHDLWQLDLKKQLQETYDSLEEKAFLLSIFRYRLTEPEIIFNQMNGCKVLNNTDLEERILAYLIAARSVGLRLIGQKFDSIGWTSILFRKINAQPITGLTVGNVIYITEDTSEWLERLKEKINDNIESENKTNIWLIANDSTTNGVIGLTKCLRYEPGGQYIRCLFAICDQSAQLAIDLRQMSFSDLINNDLAINVIKDGKTGTYRNLTLAKNWVKTQSDMYYLNTGKKKDISDLQWFDLRQFSSSNKTLDPINEEICKIINCNVYLCGVNQLDTDQLTSGSNTGFYTDCVLGTEFVGRRSDTGQRVMGFTNNRGFASNICANSQMISTIPEHWSMGESISVPINYLTVWYGLINRAQLRKNERVLIDLSAGGVGQAAINICQYFNCHIFVTVGINQNKDVLINTFGIPENRIFFSNDIQFKYKIKQLTEGKGVDIVFRSSSNENREVSSECVGTSGRLVDITRHDLPVNKQLSMNSLLKNFTFIGVDVFSLLSDITLIGDYFDWIHANSTNGMIKPINTQVYNVEQVDKAFQCLTSTDERIAKIVIKIRDEEKDKVLKTNFNPSNKMIVWRKTFFNANKVYIITGGLGGMGLELVHWMVYLGARKFVLTSRYGVKSDYQKFVLKRLKRFGENNRYFESNIIVSTVDTNSIEGAKKLISDSQWLGPIGGIFHLALVLNDRLVVNQTLENFNQTYDIKAKTCHNLDQLSRELKLNLDYFVVFSSQGSGKGNGGQSNYGYGLSTCERICEERRNHGFHGLAIQWGPIGDVGVIADIETFTTLFSVDRQRINSCFDKMDKMLQTNMAIISSIVKSERKVLSLSKECKITNKLWSMIGIDPKTTPDHYTLGEIGMESMFSINFQQTLNTEYGIKLSLAHIKNINIGLMKEFEAGNLEQLEKYANDCRLDCRGSI